MKEPTYMYVSSRCFEEIKSKIPVGELRYDAIGQISMNDIYLRRETAPEQKLAPDGRDPTMRPCVGDCVVTPGGIRRRTSLLTSTPASAIYPAALRHVLVGVP